MEPSYIERILEAVLTLGGLGLLASAGLGIAARLLYVKTDPREEKISEVLPRANCGGCGYPGCSGFAGAVVRGETSPAGCPVGGEEVAREIAAIMGVEVETRARCVALPFCQGSPRVAKDRCTYHGVMFCTQAHLLSGGPKACLYGCLGLGSCVEACPFGALRMGEDSLPVVDAAKCTSCGKCVEACPRGIMRLVPETATAIVLCRSREKGKTVKEACTLGCIACGACARVCPVEAITMEDNLPIIDWDKCTSCGLCAAGCPTDSIVDRRTSVPV